MMEKSVLEAAVMDNPTGSAVQMRTTVLPLKLTALLPTSSTWSLRRFDLCLSDFFNYKTSRLGKNLLLVMELTAQLAAVLENTTGSAVQMDSTVLPLKISAPLPTSSTWQD